MVQGSRGAFLTLSGSVNRKDNLLCSYAIFSSSCTSVTVKIYGLPNARHERKTGLCLVSCAVPNQRMLRSIRSFVLVWRSDGILRGISLNPRFRCLSKFDSRGARVGVLGWLTSCNALSATPRDFRPKVIVGRPGLPTPGKALRVSAPRFVASASSPDMGLPMLKFGRVREAPRTYVGMGGLL